MTEFDDRLVRFGDKKAPMKKVREVLQSTQSAVDVLRRLNETYPHLASDRSRRTVNEVNHRLKNFLVGVDDPKVHKQQVNIEDVARDLLARHGPEEAMELLMTEHQVSCDLQGLLRMAGVEAYQRSLVRDVHELQANKVGYDQIADLWNEFGRPAPGKPFWDAKSVERMMAEYGE
jgi:hypothetical protein